MASTYALAALAALALTLALVLALAAPALAATTTGDIIGTYEKYDASAFIDDSHCPTTLRTESFDFDQYADPDFR